MTKSIDRDPPSQIRAVRRFNRLYAQALDAMEGNLLPGYAMAELRILAEVAHRPGITATQLIEALGLDAGYMSRLLKGMSRRRLLVRTPSAKDARNRELRLSALGKQVFGKLDRAASARVADALAALTVSKRRKLIGAMELVGKLLQEEPGVPHLILRPPGPGELGWVIQRHGTVIAEQFGWDARFEQLVAGIVGDFVQQYDAASDRCWIAEYDGEPMGSIFLMREDATTAKLRLLFVEPAARGLGIGRKLVEKTVREAKRLGYKKLVLWTNSGLDSARRIYEAAGFALVQEAPHDEFSSSKLDTLGQRWELSLIEENAKAVEAAF